MPALAALDECLTILAQISRHADDGLADSANQYEALLEIQRCCNEIDATIQGIMAGMDDDEAPERSLLN